jgi:sugar transferase EpsL
MTYYRRCGKRVLDLIAVVVSIPIAVPLVLAVCAFTRAILGSPVLFRQVRPGRAGALFTLLKVRTMVDARPGHGDPKPDELRLTRFGRAVRASSLDELPSLWNVFRGEMSLVGPRPLLVEYLSLYTSTQARRHEVRPGITGWAQVNGRNALTWEEKLGLDVWYVDNVTLWLDLKIMFMTMVDVLRTRGISAPGHSTMPRFRGAADPDRRE